MFYKIDAKLQKIGVILSFGFMEFMGRSSPFSRNYLRAFFGTMYERTKKRPRSFSKTIVTFY